MLSTHTSQCSALNNNGSPLCTKLALFLIDQSFRRTVNHNDNEFAKIYAAIVILVCRAAIQNISECSMLVKTHMF